MSARGVLDAADPASGRRSLQGRWSTAWQARGQASRRGKLVGRESWSWHLLTCEGIKSSPPTSSICRTAETEKGRTAPLGGCDRAGGDVDPDAGSPRHPADTPGLRNVGI